MHGEDCAAICDPRHTRPRRRDERARRCQSPSCVSTGGAYAHGRTLIHDVIDHRRRRRCARRRNLFSPTSPVQRMVEPDGIEPTTSCLQSYALSQLSYGPDQFVRFPIAAVVGPDRFELSTPRLSSVCSNQLSYGPSPAAATLRADPRRLRRNWARNSRHAARSRRARVQEKRNEDGGEPHMLS